MADDEVIAVFVYGTLRRGQSNHHLLAGARWGGEQRLPGARLHNLGPFPMAIVTPDTAADAVQGELWWVDAATLAQRAKRRHACIPPMLQYHWLGTCEQTICWLTE
jgi:hypothetical protein